MIKSFVITPYFLETAKENQVLTNDLFEFILVDKDLSKKLFLVIDNNSNFIEKYKNIATKVGAKNIICDSRFCFKIKKRTSRY